jgi:hypothetical protein
MKNFKEKIISNNKSENEISFIKCDLCGKEIGNPDIKKIEENETENLYTTNDSYDILDIQEFEHITIKHWCGYSADQELGFHDGDVWQANIDLCEKCLKKLFIDNGLMKKIGTYL